MDNALKKSYTFALNCGYAENGSLSFAPFTSREKYATAKEALLDLAAFFKERYDQRNAPQYKECCLVTKAKDAAARFCKNCGRTLEEEEFDVEDFTEFVSGICRADCDTFHGEYIDYDEDHRWQPGGLEQAVADGSLRFVYTAEHVLAAATGHSPYPDKVTIESIFKDRTRSRGKSFAFWGH